MNLLNNENDLLANRGLNALDINCISHELLTDSEQFKEQIIHAIQGGQAQLPMHPGFENHPYKGLLENKEATKYIIGTFPPISYLIDSIQAEGHPIQQLIQPTHPHQRIPKPQIPFFHGNASSLWAALLTPAELNELRAFLPHNRMEARQYLIDKLNTIGIYYDDIILSTQRNLGKLEPKENLGYSHKDKYLKNICPDLNLVQQVLNHPNLDVVCFTNGATFGSGKDGGLQLYTQINRRGLIKTGSSDALSLFLRNCQEIGLNIEMKCLPFFDWTILHQLTVPQKRTKLIFELRLTKSNRCTLPELNTFQQKAFTAITPYSPAAHGQIENSPIVEGLKMIYGQHLNAGQLLPYIYAHFRNNTYNQLNQYNINQ